MVERGADKSLPRKYNNIRSNPSLSHRPGYSSIAILGFDEDSRGSLGGVAGARDVLMRFLAREIIYAAGSAMSNDVKSAREG